MFGLGHAEGMRASRKVLRCSFCAKTQDDVQKLIAGPADVCICDECVAVCDDLLADGRSTTRDETSISLEATARSEARRKNLEPDADAAGIPLWHVRCGLCQMIVATDDALLVEARGILCRACADAVAAAVADVADRGAREGEGA